MNRRNEYRLLAVASLFVCGIVPLRSVVRAESPTTEAPLTVEQLINIPKGKLVNVDIAAMNLACAVGLPGAENLDVPAVLAKLDLWARYIKWQTDRHLYRLRDPKWAKAYANSEARLRMEMIVGACQQDFAIRYNEPWMKNPTFDDSTNMFIHGMFGYGEGGTCSSMPVLYVALGRRLGYPMYLVRAKRHFFVRWDGWGERVNMDGSVSSGIGFETDEFYHAWPEPMSEADLSSGMYLTNLSPARELAVFLQTRGICQAMNMQFKEALDSFEPAARLSPKDRIIRANLNGTAQIIDEIRGLSQEKGRLILIDPGTAERLLDAQWSNEVNDYESVPISEDTPWPMAGDPMFMTYQRPAFVPHPNWRGLASVKE